MAGKPSFPPPLEKDFVAEKFRMHWNDGANYCPVCGSNDLYVAQGCGGQVGCSECKFEGPWVDGHRFESERIDAIAAWNRLSRRSRLVLRIRWRLGMVKWWMAN